ncbi:hypothetical protein DXG01_014982 [Tephrocybe rancida]|nr:hypothetical protein DXG01_014982 [Tephrocybe rancida]
MVIPGWMFPNQRVQRSAHSTSPSPLSSHSLPAKHGMRSFPSASSIHLLPTLRKKQRNTQSCGLLATMPLHAILHSATLAFKH